ncbi:hypothetical protein [uncultured Winogradskyella sp.]|uniref:hypothetical protein n=1 Tax=uncultured Winogradskyella sp. TaxID=395353 RepID=UPI0026065620|nr:hypothetical protein [uncultured Winogradskyella sp.]
MKPLITFIFALLLLSCNSTQLVDTWKNPEITTYSPTKVLVVGLTSNLEARQEFENKLKYEFEMRGAEAASSMDVFNPSFKSEKLTIDDLKALENDLTNDGFDTILFTKIVGVEDKMVEKIDYGDFDETHKKFREDYLKHQDIFYDPEYYDAYTVYHAETSMYCICPSKDRELIWKGYIDIIDPRSGDDTIKNYVNLILLILEEEQLINVKQIIEEKPQEQAIN